MNSMVADLLTLTGMVLTAIGAWRAASAVILKEDDAITIGVARYSGENREENLKLPAVQNLLRSSKGAQWGFRLIAGGTVLQILPIIAGFAIAAIDRWIA
ncbi:hypothetical protein IPU75_08360 [Ochrobactrum sp. SD129]|nr:hypothetical protein [Ochrobactrum sp. SD129]